MAHLTISISSVSGSLDTTTDLYVGKDSTGNYFNGSIDSVIIYKGLALNNYDAYNRYYNTGQYFLVNNRIAGSGSTGFAAINQSDNGYGAIIGIADGGANTNTSGYPLGVWNDFATSDVYNLIYFGTTSLATGSSTEYGNLKWDSANSKFLLSNSLDVEGDLEADYFVTEGNEALGFDIIRHTVTTGETSSFTEAWSTATTKKIVNMHVVTVDESDANDTLSVDDWTNSGRFDTALEYDGTNITCTAQFASWEIGDIVTIFIVYEK
jgi:hypothetical protein